MKYLFLVFALLAFSCGKKEDPAPFPKAEAPQLEVSKATIAPRIDGKPDDPAWQKTDWLKLDQLWQGQKSDQNIQYKLTWTPDALYVLVHFKNLNPQPNTGNPLEDYDRQDRLVIYLDENNSGGLYDSGFEVFTYNVLPNGFVVGYDAEKLPKTYNNHINHKIFRTKQEAYHELRIAIFDQNFKPGSPNMAVSLSPNKELGFAMAYVSMASEEKDSNTILGSVAIPEDYKNRINLDSGLFATLQLVE
ncbi:sugar-binding protein [Leeuwenhoekiella sp. H156]|uniref:sugar-binding protein n=1 Tax=Leeuwenhoekiella sp. H156 TaxID=3450128 RepID=UPI003FA48D02